MFALWKGSLAELLAGDYLLPYNTAFFFIFALLTFWLSSNRDVKKHISLRINLYGILTGIRKLKTWMDVITHSREKGNQDCLYILSVVLKIPVQRIPSRNVSSFQWQLVALQKQLSSLAAWVIIFKNDPVFSYYILPYGNPSPKYADHGLISVRLVFHRITGLLSLEEWREVFLVLLHCFHSCRADSQPLLRFLCPCNRSAKVDYMLRFFGNGLDGGRVRWICWSSICTFHSPNSTALWFHSVIHPYHRPAHVDFTCTPFSPPGMYL